MAGDGELPMAFQAIIFLIGIFGDHFRGKLAGEGMVLRGLRDQNRPGRVGGPHRRDWISGSD
jgi:hypothetical protein